MVPNNVLVSTFRKDGVPEFCALLHETWDIYASGGTADVIRSVGVNVHSTDTLTGFVELIEGRVKTLHPAVLAGLFAEADNDAHIKQLEEKGFPFFNLLVWDPYNTHIHILNRASRKGVNDATDVGGPTMASAALKGGKTVLCDHRDFDRWIEAFMMPGATPAQQRMLYRELRQKAFNVLAGYAAMLRWHNELADARDADTSMDRPAGAIGVILHRYIKSPDLYSTGAALLEKIGMLT